MGLWGVNWIGLLTIVRRDVTRISRAPIHIFVTPLMSALLFIFVFGLVVGNNLPTIEGHKYREFMLPGILTMTISTQAYSQTATVIYWSRFLRVVEEMLVAPLSYAEMLFGALSGAIFRISIIGTIIFLIGIAAGGIHVQSWSMFLFWIVSITTTFSLFGQIIGLVSQRIEQVAIPSIFFFAPLSMLGGVFNTASMLPPWVRYLNYGNPYFYFISGIRGAMIGFNEIPADVAVALTLVLLITLSALTWRLYAQGYGLRE